MRKINEIGRKLDQLLVRLGIEMRMKLIILFLVIQVIPIVLLTAVAWRQINILGQETRELAVSDSKEALNDSAVENIERMTTDTAQAVADFLYARDDDLLFLATLEPTEEAYQNFADSKTGRLIDGGEWELSEDGTYWVNGEEKEESDYAGEFTNSENNDMDGFRYRADDQFDYIDVPYYDEITFVDTNGVEQIKITTNSTKVNYPLSSEKKDVSQKENTYVKAETYFEEVQDMEAGEIYVSDVIGAYVGSNYIGMYIEENVDRAAEERGYEIDYDPESQAYAGEENPNGTRFEGIVRWATPVTDDSGEVIGYVTFALNHDHIMEFVDHLTPMSERYTQLPNAYGGNYAFIWDYQCRSICHPRHHSIVGYDPDTGNEEIPWLEQSIYDEWQENGIEDWTEFIADYPTFNEQSREKSPASELTRAGLVGLDGRYLNNAPQCTGWMDLTEDGGSGSFYILWSGLYKLTTAGAIPYYTGQYEPSEDNNYSKRGFGFVTIGAGLEDFTRPAAETEMRLSTILDSNLNDTVFKLVINVIVLAIAVMLIAVWVASSLTGNITRLIDGISRFRAGERQFRFEPPVKNEFGLLAEAFDDMADSLVASATHPLTIIDKHNNIIYMNNEGLDYTKKKLDEIVGQSYSEHSAYPTGSVYDPIEALENGTEPEIMFNDKNGRYIKGTASHFYSRSGREVGYIVETLDVTEMVLEQKKVEEQRTLLNEVFSASPDLTWYMNTKNEYIMVNPRFSEMVGKSIEEIEGKKASEVLPDYIGINFAINDKKALKLQQPYYSEEKIQFADNHVEVLDSVRTPVFDSDENLIGVLGFARNVTLRVNIENELRRTQMDLEDAVKDANLANAHKGEFLARMSHEIRTPMNAIIGITGIVLKKLDSAENDTVRASEIKSNILQIESSSQHLLGLLNDILDLSKIEAGKIELVDEVMNIRRLEETVTTMIRPRCEEKKIEFVTDFDILHPATFSFDSLRLRQVLINLLGNAVKFTRQEGRIELAVKKLEQKDGKTYLRFMVKDNGAGIAKDAQDKIFLAFEQESGMVAKQHGGTGLGLPISKRIVELFGGELKLDSRLGEGSTFSFDIWLDEAEEEMPEEDALTNITDIFKDKRLLLVDDVEINRMIVAEMLIGTGIIIDEADDGEAAVRLFEESAEHAYDIILMDVQMPHMDGYQATSAIRKSDRSDAGTVPIITLTANAFKEDIETALAYGMNAHVAKPVELNKLIEVLFKYLNRY